MLEYWNGGPPWCNSGVNRRYWYNILKSYWELKEIFYTCYEHILKNLALLEIPVGFAIRYFKDVCKEFGTLITVSHGGKPQQKTVPRYVSSWREGEKIEITDWWRTESNSEIDYMSFHRNTKFENREGNVFGKFKLASKSPQK